MDSPFYLLVDWFCDYAWKWVVQSLFQEKSNNSFSSYSVEMEDWFLSLNWFGSKWKPGWWSDFFNSSWGQSWLPYWSLSLWLFVGSNMEISLVTKADHLQAEHPVVLPVPVCQGIGWGKYDGVLKWQLLHILCNHMHYSNLMKNGSRYGVHVIIRTTTHSRGKVEKEKNKRSSHHSPLPATDFFHLTVPYCGMGTFWRLWKVSVVDNTAGRIGTRCPNRNCESLIQGHLSCLSVKACNSCQCIS